MNTLNVKLYDVLRKELNLSEEKARHITQAIEEVVKDNSKTTAHEYSSAFKNDFKDLDAKLEKETSRLEIKIEQSKNEMIRWYIGLFIALSLMILALFLHK